MYRKIFLFALILAVLPLMDLKACCCYYDWSGPYIGINGEGYSWGNVDYQFPPGGSGSNGSNLFSPDATGGSFHQRPHGAILGGQLGFNHHWRNFVVGLEGTINRSWVEKTSVDVFAPAVQRTVQYHTSLRWFATITPRLGFVCQNMLYFAKAGLVAGRFEPKFSSNADIMGSTHTFKQRQDHLGWNFGAGIEYGWCHWILGLEYDHYHFSKGHYGGQVNPSTPFSFAFLMNASTLNTIVARLSYRFWRN